VTTLRFAELFAGAGGMSLGLHRAGMDCAFHAEIADFPRRVLTHRFPDVPLYGDVMALNGAELTAKHGAIDLLAGGSPCQDLSVAGKRKGMTEGSGTRSSLFYEQLRLWEETNAQYLLWENVAGALSSNGGRDFAAVLSAIVGATVAVPRDGWGGDESGGGVASGPRAVAAWRLLDAQWFGVPQRRLRVFVLGARAGGCDPAEVLLEPQGVYRDSPTRREAREGLAAGVEDRPSISFVLGSDPISRVGGAAQPVTCRNGDPGCVLAFDALNNTTADTAHTLRSNMDRASGYGGVYCAPLQEVGKRTGKSTTDIRAGIGIGADGDPMFTLQASAQHGVVCATGTVTHALTHEGYDAGEDGTGRGTPIICMASGQANAEIVSDGDPSLTALHEAPIVFRETVGALQAHNGRDHFNNAQSAAQGHIVVGTLESREHGGGFPGSDGATSGHVQATAGIPRRLMPIECERLMSWDDNWTNVPDEKGKPASDSVRYKAIGNGVVSNVAQWIAGRLIVMHQALVA
jgi:DNA (cytosine-5)-methyltransferase 1